MSTLFIVATPLGNLNDLAPRALETLRSVAAIACEDTRVTSKLLAHFKISQPLLIVNAHSRFDKVLARLETGEDVAYVSDAGTPGISDPGARLVAAALNASHDVTPIPGPSAVATAISISGFDTTSFVFLGFPPHKKGRDKFFTQVVAERRMIVFYESTHRIVKTLGSLAKVAPERPLVVCKELTKKFERTFRGLAEEILSELAADPSLTKGEFTIVVSPIK